MSTHLRAAPPPVRDLQDHEHAKAADVLARAFLDDPVLSWLIPSTRHRYARMKRFFRAELDGHTRRGRVLVTDDLSAVSLWAEPDRWRTPPLDVARNTHRTLLSFRHRVTTALGLLTEMEKAHPEEPHWYLAVVGADPSRQGSGAGRAVIQAVLDDCDAQGLPAYLESSNPANVPYYARLGFQATGDLTPPGGPTLTLMWRDPR